MCLLLYGLGWGMYNLYVFITNKIYWLVQQQWMKLLNNLEQSVIQQLIRLARRSVTNATLTSQNSLQCSALVFPLHVILYLPIKSYISWSTMLEVNLYKVITFFFNSSFSVITLQFNHTVAKICYLVSDFRRSPQPFTHGVILFHKRTRKSSVPWNNCW